MRTAFALLLAGLALALGAGPAAAAAPAACPGSGAFHPNKVISGEFGQELQGSYVMLPFDVAAGTTQVKVRYCWDQPDVPSNGQFSNTLDLGVYEPRTGGSSVWGAREFRGWGGSSHPEVQVTPQGFSAEAQYKAAPKGNVPGRTTRGFVPGPMPAGEWAVELGVAAVIPPTQGNTDGKVAWRVEIEQSDDPSFAADPYRATPYDSAPVRPGPGWYAGDMHVHAEHSNLGAATMTETFDYAFKPIADGGAGLDFVTLSDYVSGTAWPEIGRYQSRYPGHLIERSAEVITYRGHTNNHGSHRFVDYRTGPLLERDDQGAVHEIRAAQPARRIFDDVHAANGWTQINHPTIFPSAVPGFSSFCRGCPWDYSEEETDYSKVDAIEIATGPPGLRTAPSPGPNPFTPLAIKFWEDQLAKGHHIAAVGSSDSHDAGEAPATDPLSSPLGTASTVVYAPELSERGIECGVLRGHTYVKVWGNAGPDIRLDAAVPGRSEPLIMGDSTPSTGADFTAHVTGAAPGADPAKPDPFELQVWKDGVPLLVVPVTSGDFSLPFPSLGAGRYRLQLMRGTSVEAVGSPIYLGSDARPRRCPGIDSDAAAEQAPAAPTAGVEAPAADAAPGAAGAPPQRAGAAKVRLRLRVLSRRRGRAVLRLTANGSPLPGTPVRLGRQRARTDRRGLVRFRLRAGRALATVPGIGRAGVLVRAR